MRATIDGIAQAIADLRYIHASHWILRLGGFLGLLLAAVLVIGLPRLDAPAAILLMLVIAVLGVVQAALPDSDIGLVGVLVLIIVHAVDGPALPPSTVGIAILLYLAHTSWALAATTPPYAVVRAAAWRAHARAALPPLVIGVLAGLALLLLARSGLQPGGWVLIPGVLAIIVLLVLLLPHGPVRARR